jgi:hypothetical protein
MKQEKTQLFLQSLEQIIGISDSAELVIQVQELLA